LKQSASGSASEKIEGLIASLPDWQARTLSEIRRIVLESDPEMTEEWKWMGTPTWNHYGIVLIANPHKDKVKLTFKHGADLPDPDKIFNNGFGGGQWRAIDLFQKDKINEPALKSLIRAGVDHNKSRMKKVEKAKSSKIVRK
jgi:hypothetical protein